jgi:hypothetical protein
MKLKCLGCTVGSTAVLQCCSNVAWDTDFPHVTKMINKMNENPNQYAIEKKSSDQHNSPPKTTQFQCSGKPT